MAGKPTAPRALIEVSSEAGRKIGGIYTVIRSKSGELAKKFGENYLLVGMLDEKCAEDVKFEEPEGKLAGIFAELAKGGVHCKFGRWMYGHDARIILVDAREAGERKVEFVDENRGRQYDTQANYAKYMLWKSFGIDSLMEKSWDFTENVVWGMGVGMLLEKLFNEGLFDSKETAVQFHEWISGPALLYCKIRGPNLATVFTTHATVLGRTLAAAGVDVYAEAKKASAPISLNVAYNNRVEGKHQLEAAAARECTVFTTVSETVGEEVAYILGRKPDVITVNGIDMESEGKDKGHDLSDYARRELQQFLEACFISYYGQRYDDALFTYISGRYEFSNKGFDLYIAALGKLNAKLKKKKAAAEGKTRRVFAFIFAPSSVKGPKISIIKNYLLLDKMREILDEIPETRGVPYVNLPDVLSRLSGGARHDLENMARGFYKDGEKPHINCYDLTYQNDAIINACVAAGLDNREENPVKVIFYPTYMKPNDGLMNLNYYDIVAAIDVGVFPSRYEPFGYTPVEAAVNEDIAITSDMTGFGRFIEKYADRKGCGVSVLRMAGRSFEQSCDELAIELERIYGLPQAKLAGEKRNARLMMRHLDWKGLVKNYYSAYSLAISKIKK